MLTVSTYIARSPIHGIGLFAAEPIPRGTVIWKLSPAFDRLVSQTDIDELPPPAREQMQRYTAMTDRGEYFLCGDEARHTNHSDEPNCSPMDAATLACVAVRDIAKDEEITDDYRVSDRRYASVKGPLFG